MLVGLKKVMHKLKEDHFPEFFCQRTFSQFLKYVVVGILSFSTEVSLLYICKEYYKLWYIYGNSIAFVVVFILNFLLNRFWAFKSKEDFKKQMILSGILFIFNFFASNIMMYFFTDILKLYYLISKVIAVGVVVSWNFILYKKVIYK
jgi:putative flippase GtrA